MSFGRRLAMALSSTVPAEPGTVTPPVIPPPAPEPGPDAPPVVETRAATSVIATGATLNGEVVSLGGFEAADTRFRWRQTGAGAWNETTPVERIAPGEFSVALDTLPEATGHDFQVAFTWSDGGGEGAIFNFTTGVGPGVDPNTWATVTAAAVQRFEPTSEGDLSGPAGTWASSGEGFRLTNVTSPVNGNPFPALGMRLSWKTYEPVAWMEEPEFTWVFVLQLHGSQAGVWNNFLSRDDGSSAADRYSAGVKNDGTVTWRPRKAGQSALQVDTPAGQAMPGDIVSIFMGVGASGAFVRVGMNAEVVNAGITSLGAMPSPLVLGAYRDGQAPFYGAWGGALFFDSRLTTEQMDDIVAETKANIRFAPPISVSGVVGEEAGLDYLARTFMASAAPTPTIVAQPANATVEFVDNLAVISPTAPGTELGSYKLTDANGDSQNAVITVVAIGAPISPEDITQTLVGEGGSTVIDGASSTVQWTWANGYTPQAGDRITLTAGHRSATATPAAVGAYPVIIHERADLTLSSLRRGIDIFDFIANGAEGATITVDYGTATAAVGDGVAHRLSAGWGYGDIVATGQASAENKSSVTVTTPAENTAFSVVSAFVGRPDASQPEPGDLRLQATDVVRVISATSADGQRKLRGAIGTKIVAGNAEVPERSEWS